MEEGHKVSEIELMKKWQEILSFYDVLIENGHRLRPIRFLVRHIIDNGYWVSIFPGTSFYNLLISLTAKNTIDFTKTLKIEIDDLHGKVNFKYRDFTGKERNVENLQSTLKWFDTCELTEINDTFEHFLMLHKDWNEVKKTTSANQT